MKLYEKLTEFEEWNLKNYGKILKFAQKKREKEERRCKIEHLHKF